MSTSQTAPHLGVVQPRLDGRGGLEKYCLYLVEALTERLPVEVVTAHQVNLQALERSFNVRLDQSAFVADPRCDPQVRSGGRWEQVSSQLQATRAFKDLTRQYDLLVGHTISLPWECAAKRSVLICHFPTVRRHRIDSSVPHVGVSSLLHPRGREQRTIRRRVNSWSQVVVSSRFAQRWVQIYWDRDAEVIYPPIELPTAPDLSQKKPWIIGAGYFARPSEPGDIWGYKRQEVLIDTFRQLCDAGLEGWELHLAGHMLIAPPDDQRYLDELRARAPGYPIHLHVNCPHSELMDLYRQGSVFWHATGYNIDQETCPDRMEHFGMVTAEAMGWGCVPVVVNKGGQPEIVEAGVNGYLWDTPEQCRDLTLGLAKRPDELRRLAEGAIRRAEHFSPNRFRERVHTLLEAELGHLATRRH